MRCANCGNKNPKLLFDEGDTIYCSKCCHRTQIATGADDLITCPYCGRMRDRKAFQCMWCGNSIGQNIPPSKELFEELDGILNEFEDTLEETNLRYWNLSKKRRQ